MCEIPLLSCEEIVSSSCYIFCSVQKVSYTVRLDFASWRGVTYGERSRGERRSQRRVREAYGLSDCHLHTWFIPNTTLYGKKRV
jgi:hypothetical protein